MTHLIGVKITQTCTIKDMDDVVYDPAKVELTIEEPDATQTTFTYADAEITRLDIGVYMKSFVITQEGWHYCGWQAIAKDGTSELYEEDKIRVGPSLIKKEIHHDE